MDKEAESTIQVLKLALQMEVDGREFYLQASEKSVNPALKKLFLRLSEDEEEHYRTFYHIFESIMKSGTWPESGTSVQPEKSAHTIFREAAEALSERPVPAASELEAIDEAVKMEDRSYRLYLERGEKTVRPREKSLYQALSREERGHYLALLDSREYLTNPEGWFTEKEHWSLDGA